VIVFVCGCACVGDCVWVFVHVSVGAWVCGCVGVHFLRVSVWMIVEVSESFCGRVSVSVCVYGCVHVSVY